MDFINLVTELAQQSKYFLLFIIYLIEGPVAGFISATISTTGQLNIYIVFGLFLSAEIAADIFYYYLGKGLTESKFNKRLSKYEKNVFLGVVKKTFNIHPVKTLLFIKVIGVIAVPSLMLIGKYQSLKWKKFFIWTSIICFFKDLTITIMGYWIGISLSEFLVGYDIYKIIVGIIGILAIGYIFFLSYRTKIDKYLIKLFKNIKE